MVVAIVGGCDVNEVTGFGVVSTITAGLDVAGCPGDVMTEERVGGVNTSLSQLLYHVYDVAVRRLYLCHSEKT